MGTSTGSSGEVCGGKSLHNFDLESYDGAHRVALEAVSEMKTQAEAKLHIYCLF
jgi:hypothetical protein